MMEKATRRSLATALIGGALTLGSALNSHAQVPAQVPEEEEKRSYTAPTFKPKFKKPKLSKTLVQDFVLFGHYDLDMVKKLLEIEPAVLNATVDWGGGDFETALGGASHLGNKEIAAFLIDKGARPDIFTWAMFGKLEVVKSLIAFHPPLSEAKGPHGIPLIVHARMGLKNGVKEAEEVVEFLERLKKA